MVELRVLHNGDDVLLVWRPPAPVADCRGFAVRRKRNGVEELASSYAGFENETWEKGEFRPTTVWPVQKYMWVDYKPVAGDTLSYRVIPVVRGADGKLATLDAQASKWSDEVKLDPQVSDKVACYFNRGIVATQWVQRMLGASDKVRARATKLDKVIEDTGSVGRKLLGGQLYAQIQSLLADAAAKQRKIWAALFELTDDELIAGIAALGKDAYIVLADGAPDRKKGETDENKDARAALKGKVQLFNRMTGGKFLAHNKIVVIGDDNGGKARWVWTGSTNWTASGLCSQANNGILIDDAKLAARFQKQIEALKDAKGSVPASLEAANNKAVRQPLAKSDVTVWFTRTKGQVDLKSALDKIAAAKDGAIFLLFQSGMTNSLLGGLMARRDEPSFFVHGVISTQPPEPGTPRGTSDDGEPKKKKTHAETIANQVAFVHRNERIAHAPDLLIPFAIEGDTEHWFDEFVKKNGAHAIVHSKVVVLDPFGERPVVMTGSHNMGTTASSKNDENLVIIEGDHKLAQAYAVNIMSIYNNYRWRYRAAEGSKWRGLKDRDDWQDDYYEKNRGELDFWLKKEPAPTRE